MSAAASRNGIIARHVSLGNYYTLQYNTAALQWQLARIVGGAQTTLGVLADTIPIGTARIGRLSLLGTSLTAAITGVGNISAVDSFFAAAGSAGIQSSQTDTETTGVHIGNLRAGDFNPDLMRRTLHLRAGARGGVG